MTSRSTEYRWQYDRNADGEVMLASLIRSAGYHSHIVANAYEHAGVFIGLAGKTRRGAKQRQRAEFASWAFALAWCEMVTRSAYGDPIDVLNQH